MIWRLGVVGSPIAHSLSPALHEAGLALAGLSGTSRRLQRAAGGATDVAGLMGNQFDALSVTMPLKPLLAPLCTELDPVAGRLGAVNSLLWRDGALHGANTDGAGFLDALDAEHGLDPRGLRVAVLGAGGAARALVDALLGAGASEILVVARNADAAAQLVALDERVRAEGALDRCDLVVNTAPAGVITAVATEWGVGASTVGVDITYEPRHSAFRAMLEARGCATSNGLGMLAYQAARQMSWWWGVELDGAALREVIA